LLRWILIFVGLEVVAGCWNVFMAWRAGQKAAAELTVEWLKYFPSQPNLDEKAYPPLPVYLHAPEATNGQGYQILALPYLSSEVEQSGDTHQSNAAP
jgi:hypothetical protein